MASGGVAVVRVLGRLLAAVMLVLLQGCITVEGDGDGGNDRSGAEGAPTDKGDGSEAPGAPIDIPAITDSQGLPADEVRARLEGELREACGGEVCLDIEVAETDENFETCSFTGDTIPPLGTQVQRGSTVTLVMGSKPCTADDNDGDSLPDDADGDGTPDVLDDDADGDGTPDVEQSPP